MPPKKARSEKNHPKISFFTTSEKENPWSEDETDTGTTTKANEPIEADDDVQYRKGHTVINHRDSGHV